jgi:hypothetical protein
VTDQRRRAIIFRLGGVVFLVHVPPATGSTKCRIFRLLQSFLTIWLQTGSQSREAPGSFGIGIGIGIGDGCGQFMNQPKTILEIIENLEEQKRLFEVLLAGGRGLSRDALQNLVTTIIAANDRTQALLDAVVRHDAVLAAGSMAASRKLN